MKITELQLNLSTGMNLKHKMWCKSWLQKNVFCMIACMQISKPCQTLLFRNTQIQGEKKSIVK